MVKLRLRLVTPTTENRTVTPRRAKNGTLRTREHLTIDEVERLIEAAKTNFSVKVIYFQKAVAISSVVLKRSPKFCVGCGFHKQARSFKNPRSLW
jgi:hypothetical protein